AWPAATEGVGKPPPIPLTSQTSFGPPPDHSLSSPVSGETPERSAPRQPGQSLAPAGTRAARTASETHNTSQRLRGIASLLKRGSGMGAVVLPGITICRRGRGGDRSPGGT